MDNKPQHNIFTTAYLARKHWNSESDTFFALGKHIIERKLKDADGFAEFSRFVSHYTETDPEMPGWMQLRFGNRVMGRRDGHRNIASEVGPSLVYSRGPSGEMTAIMYPIRSELARVPEDSILLRIGFFDYWQLLSFVEQDMNDLMAYAYVSSIDITASRPQRWRIGWLRFSSSQHVEGKHQYSALRSGLIAAAKSAWSGTLSGAFRVATPLAIGWFVGRYLHAGFH